MPCRSARISATCSSRCSIATSRKTSRDVPVRPPAERTGVSNRLSSAAATVAMVFRRFSSNSLSSSAMLAFARFQPGGRCSRPCRREPWPPFVGASVVGAGSSARSDRGDRRSTRSRRHAQESVAHSSRSCSVPSRTGPVARRGELRAPLLSTRREVGDELFFVDATRRPPVQAAKQPVPPCTLERDDGTAFLRRIRPVFRRVRGQAKLDPIAQLATQAMEIKELAGLDDAAASVARRRTSGR